MFWLPEILNLHLFSFDQLEDSKYTLFRLWLRLIADLITYCSDACTRTYPLQHHVDYRQQQQQQ